MITTKMTLADVVKQYPQTIPYLNDLHLDYCCGGHLPMEESLTDGSVDLSEVLKELNRLAEQKTAEKEGPTASIESFKKLSVYDMLADLEATHHVTEREMMGQIDQLLNKILIVHYPHHGEELTRVHSLFSRAKADLEEHFAKEERLVFPLMRANPHPDAETIARVKELEDEHTVVGDILKEIQDLTGDFTLPDDACATFAQTYRTMKAFTEDVFVHVFKENSIAFPEYEELK